MTNLAIWWEDVVATFTLCFIDDNRWKYITDGLLVTIQVTILALLMGIVLGVIIAAIRSGHDQQRHNMSGFAGKLLGFFNGICKVYLTVIRGTPAMVQLMIMYFVILVNSNSKLLVAVLAFGINSGAYVAEIVRGGIMSIDKGQTEAARSLGLGYIPTMRFVVIPQAIKNILPSLGNEMITLLKETSIVTVIGLGDLTKGASIIQGRTFEAMMPLFAIALVYLALVMMLTFGLSKLEGRLRASDRR